MPSRGHRSTCRCWRRIPANLAHLWNWLRLSPVLPNQIEQPTHFFSFLFLTFLDVSPIMKTVNSWCNAKLGNLRDTSWTFRAFGSWTLHHLLWSSDLVTEQVSRLPSTARVASASAKVEDWSLGLNNATLGKSVKRSSFIAYKLAFLVFQFLFNFVYKECLLDDYLRLTVLLSPDIKGKEDRNQQLPGEMFHL